MLVESPISLNSDFIHTPFGQKSNRFLTDLYVHQSSFPIAIGRAATLLCFSSETAGTKSIRDWERGGILRVIESGELTLPSVIMAKLVQMRIFEAHQQDTHPTYQEIYDSIQTDLQQTQLVTFLGTLNPIFGRKLALVKVDEEILFDEEGFWWIDPTAFLPGRRGYERFRA